MVQYGFFKCTEDLHHLRYLSSLLSLFGSVTRENTVLVGAYTALSMAVEEANVILGFSNYVVFFLL